jgi:hypothetical protein
MPHNLAHILYELRRKAGHTDFLSEEAITVIRQISESIELGNLVVQSQARGPAYFVGDNGVRRNFCINPSFEHDLTSWVAAGNATSKAAQFTAANSEFLSGGDVIDVEIQDIAIAFWIYIDSTGQFGIINKRDRASATNLGYAIELQSDGTLDFFISDGTSVTTISSTTNLGTGAFKFCVLNADRDGNATFYINAGSAEGAASISSQDGTLVNAITFQLGAGFSASANRFFGGRLAGVGIWRGRILTSAERTFLYNSGNGRPHEALGLLDAGIDLKTNLVSYYNLVEASGTRNDSQGSNNLTDNATVTQATGLPNHIANARDTTRKNTGISSLKLALVDTSASGELASQRIVVTGLAATEVWSVSSSVRIEALTLAKYTLRIEFLDSSDVVQATHNVDSTTVSTSFATVANDNRTAPSTTTKIRVTVILQSTAGLASGIIHVDSILIEKVLASGSFFDGDTANGFWEGSIHASENFLDVDGTAAICEYFKASA